MPVAVIAFTSLSPQKPEGPPIARNDSAAVEFYVGIKMRKNLWPRIIYPNPFP